MPETTEVKMSVDWIVKGERLKKRKTYQLEKRERDILVDELKIAKDVTQENKGV